MTIQSTIHRNDYIGTSATATFSYSYKIFAASDLAVIERTTADVETTLVLNTDYTVSGVGETAGGSITLTAGNLATGYALAIIRRRPLLQETDIRNQGDFMPEQLEDAYDNGVMQTQSLQEQIDRSIIVPQSISGFDNELPVPIADKYLRFNAAGTGFDVVGLTNSAVGTIAIQNANNVAITGGVITGITDLAIADGGTGASTAQAAIDALTAVSGATNEHVLTKDTASGNATFKVIPPPSSASGGGISGLEISRPTVATVTATVDRLTLFDSSSTPYQANAVSVTPDITVSGAGGLDTNSEANSTWYYVWVIYDGTHTKGLFSTSATAPTMPSGYTYKRRVGAVYNDGSGNFVDFFQYGNMWFPLSGTGFDTYETGAVDTYTLTSPNVPTTAIAVRTSNLGATNVADISLDGTTVFGSLGTTNAQNYQTLIPLNSSQQHYYKRATATGAVALQNCGYLDNL